MDGGNKQSGVREDGAPADAGRSRAQLADRAAADRDPGRRRNPRCVRDVGEARRGGARKVALTGGTMHDLAIIVVSTNESHWIRALLPTVFAHMGDISVDIVV